MKTYQVGLIGAGFMAKAHSIAYDGMPMFFWPAPGMAVKKTIADLTEECAKDAAQRLGFRQGTANWRDIVDDPEIDIVDIFKPNKRHYEFAVDTAANRRYKLRDTEGSRTLEEDEKMRDTQKKEEERET